MSDAFVDFLPAFWRERRGRRKLWLARALAALVVIGGVSGHAVLESRALGRERERLLDTDRRFRLAVGRISEVTQLEDKRDQLAARLAVLRDVLARVRGGDVVQAVGRACTASAKLERLGLRLDEGGDPVMEVSLEGTCPDTFEVTALIGAMEEDDLLSSVRMGRTTKVDAYRGDMRFVITAVAARPATDFGVGAFDADAAAPDGDEGPPESEDADAEAGR